MTSDRYKHYCRLCTWLAQGLEPGVTNGVCPECGHRALSWVGWETDKTICTEVDVDRYIKAHREQIATHMRAR